MEPSELAIQSWEDEGGALGSSHNETESPIQLPALLGEPAEPSGPPQN